MAESEQSQERTEDATQQREEKSREEGQIARSRELNTAVVMLTGSGGLLVVGGMMAGNMADIFRYCFHLSTRDAFDDMRMFAFFNTAITESFWASMPLLAGLLVAALAGPLLLGGWNMSLSAAMPKMNRLDPMSGLQRMFSSQAASELVKGILKVVLFIFITVLVLKKQHLALLALDSAALPSAIAQSLHMLQWGSFFLCLGFIVIAAIDAPWQLWSHNQKLRMTKQEVRDEMKDQEGKPEVKSKIRQLQRDMARARMMSAVPNADVIITNPTHFSVALKYDMEKMDAPVVVAKGADVIAFRIREVARENRVEIIESAVLARALYYGTEIERTVPPGLYVAVAQVLAYVYQLKQYRTGRGERPVRVKEIVVPPEWQRDENGKPIISPVK
jgi:flagellar biosynthetic protein FlhB